MAIDTLLKRASVTGIPVGYGIVPDATPGIEWRQTVAWSYAGIAADPPVISEGGFVVGVMGYVSAPVYAALYGGPEDDEEEERLVR